MPSEPAQIFSARYGDGHNAGRVRANVSLEDAGLTFQFPGIAPTVWPYRDLRAADPIRNRSRDAVITSRNAAEASLYIDDALLLAQLTERAPQIKLSSERWRTARPGLAVGLAAAISYAGIWAFDLSPAKGVASTMPEKARTVLGESVIRTMPAQRRCTNPEGRQALAKLTRRLMPNGPITADSITVLDWQLLNAFAVPGNRLVLTRGIIEQAKSPDEIAAIIGHEAGHVAELHPEASLVRSVGFWALVQMVFTGTPGAVGNIGVVLAQLGYTRSAEREADGHALRLLRDAGISPKGMADFFRRMETEKPSDKTPDKPKLPGAANDIFSSHPSNVERVRYIEGQPAYPTTPALSDDDWKALRAICASADARVAPIKTSPPPPSIDVTAAAKARADEAAKAEAIRIEAAKAEKAKGEAARIEATKIDAAKTVAAKAEADRLAADEARKAEAARLEASKAQTEKLATAKAAEERAAPDQKPEQKVALATATSTPPPAAETASPPASLLDTRIQAATQRITADANDAAAFYDRGQAYAAKRDADAAIEDFTRVIALRPTETPALFWRASVYAQQKQPDKAIADYSEVIRLQPKNYAAYNNRGSLYRNQKKLDLALKDYSSAIAIDGKQPIALTNRALIQRDRSNLDAAMADLNAAIAINPNYVQALVRRGETHELKSAREAAIADYRSALKIPEPASPPSEPHGTARTRLKALGVTP